MPSGGAVLGLSAHYHDAAAALVVDGRIVAAMQEERFSRVKNDASLPRQAARACLAIAGISAAELSAVVFYENPYAKLERVMRSVLDAYPRSWRQFPRALGAQLGSKVWVLDQIAETLDVDRRKVRFMEHHRSHAAAAFLPSPFARAAVLTVDGVGEATSTAIWLGDGSTVSCVRELVFPHSLGLFYAAFTAYLGFEVNEGEYKVMGLAGHGRPRFRDELARVLRVAGDGGFALDLRFFAHTSDTELGFSPALERLLGPRRPFGRPWDLDGSDEDRRYADIAASVQDATETALLALARAARSATRCDDLCLGGGVALNAVANARLLRESGFSRIFVQPAAGDAGGALGAALLGAIELGSARPPPLASAALGEPFDAATAVSLARQLGMDPQPMSDPAAAVADRLAAGQIVAVCRGRFEWGPRALGQRSLLAAPHDVEVRERMNRVIKRREPFRPFAPAIAAASADAWFNGAPNDMTPFMTTVCATREDRAAALPAVTHVDGSARVQTVTTEAAPELAALLDAMAARTGAPIVLNTSLNGPGEPMVAGPADALSFFISHPVDAMVIGDALLTRKREAAS